MFMCGFQSIGCILHGCKHRGIRISAFQRFPLHFNRTKCTINLLQLFLIALLTFQCLYCSCNSQLTPHITMHFYVCRSMYVQLSPITHVCMHAVHINLTSLILCTIRSGNTDFMFNFLL